MFAALTPGNELHRLEKLYGYGILDTPPDVDFDTLAGFIASVCGTRMAAITLVDADRQWFKSSIGLSLKETPRAVAFCAHAIKVCDEPFVIRDATADERFRENPLVTGDPHIRFYAGMPIVTSDGWVLGTICVLDCEPRELSELQIGALAVAARIVMTLIERGSTALQLSRAKHAISLAEQEHVAISSYLNTVEDERLRLANELHAEAARRAQSQAALQYSQHHDALTTLPNRHQFMVSLEAALKVQSEQPSPRHAFSVYVVDIDHCRQINDSLGSKAGDDLLVQCAERLLDVVRADDVVARFDSDTFAIITFGTSTVKAATSIARKIRSAFEEVWHLSNIACVVTGSVGIVVVDDRYRLAQDVIRDANIAMYHSKSQGRDRYSFFHESLGSVFASRVEVDRQLSVALANDEFALAYQPIISLEHGAHALEGFEALLRWTRPDGSHVSPTAFIPAAEASGLIVPLGAWALKTACLALRRWDDFEQRAGADVQMSVNVSALQLAAPHFVATLRDVLRETATDPRRLVIEVTESATMQDVERSLRALGALRDLGIGIHIDDFGTGYSSLSYLRRLPATRVKIDRSFVSADGQDDLVDPVIAGAIISLAHRLNMKVIAEGVETQAQLSALRDLGCDAIQGYFISRPLVANDAAAFMQRY